jgi:hypothetical protein
MTDPEIDIHKIIETLQNEIKSLKETNQMSLALQRQHHENLFDMLWDVLEIVKNMEDKPENLKEWRIRCLKNMGLM